jgi:DNA repair protein RadC
VSKALKSDYLGHRKRIKAKYKSGGIKGWLDYEVLEFALSFTILRKDTKPIAKQLLSEFKTLNGVLDADRKELEKVGGISEHSALFLNFLKDIAIIYLEKGLYKKDLVSSSDVVYDYLKASLKGLADEEFKVMFLNSRNRLLAIETIQKGTVNKSVVYPRKIVERALHNHATGVIISHNHPGESLKPSEDDYSITKAIKAALRTVDIVLLDHIIIGGNGYFSFRENGVCNDFEEV